MNNTDLPDDVPDTIYKDWQEILNLLAEIADIPAALIMRLNNDNIEVCVTSQSPDNPYKKGASEHFKDSGLYCERVIKTQHKLHIPNALEDPEWDNNPDIKLNMISYLGYPLLYPNNHPFGTICILDNKPNNYSSTLDKLISKFKNVVEHHLQLIYLNKALGDKNKDFSDYINDLIQFKGLIPICSNCKSIRETENTWISIERYLSKHPEIDLTHTLCPKCAHELYPELNIDLKYNED